MNLEQFRRYLKHDRSLEPAKAAYLDLGVNRSIRQRLNTTTVSDSLFRTVLEELRKLVGMTESEFYQITSMPVIQLAEEEEKGTQDDKSTNPPTGDQEGNKDQTQTYVGVPEQIKVESKIREDYPFLTSGDCPDVLKIAVSDMITAWYQAKAGHAKLHEAASPEEELQAVTVAVESMLVNDELRSLLNHYKVHGKLPEEQPLFNKEAVNAMNPEQLLKRYNNLNTYVTRESKKLEPKEGQEPLAEEDAEKLKAKINAWNAEIEYIKTQMKA